MVKKQYIIPGLALLCVITLFLKGPIPQDQNYHHFADCRDFWGVPNFLNVVTNFPFAIVGILGLRANSWLKEKELKQITATLFTGFLLLTIGSSYYHLWPDNNILVYDRIPMSVIFMSFFSFIIYQCIGTRAGYKSFLIFNVIGIATVIYWVVTESAGRGDLRWYGMVQFFPILAIPLILILYKSSSIRWKDLILIFVFFGLAKVCEKLDKEIYNFLNYIISGHSLKHLLMAVAGYQIVIMIQHQVMAGKNS